MSKRTINEIKAMLQAQKPTEAQWEELSGDTRKGVQHLLKQYTDRQKKKEALRKQYEDMLVFEKEAWAGERQYVCGIDEAGRGPLAGPVVAGAVVLPDDYYLEGLYDSKQLSESRRESFYEQITRDADWAAGIVSSGEIDQLNIYQAARLAMKRAVSQLKHEPDHLLVDAMTLGDGWSETKLIKGDQRSVSIAAASVIAKVTRDRMMAELDEVYPGYHFKSNQGYGTKDHLWALETYGITPVHRKTFAPVKNML
ncbi:ribonuclease HII [Halobacillus sp. Cin3]|uniref:ribonuclease HII n=1 Tax=Halobacillus sp. Cin3 TaxID=2928441 RepID=UPI00248D552A|nr:ribonuclease HII [Halobacillus sp. Cin3]